MPETITFPFGPTTNRISIQFIEGIQKPVIIVFLLSAFFTILLFVTINSLQGLALSEILSIPSNNLGNLTGSLTFYDEISALASVLLWGLASDFVGRFPVLSIGFFLKSLGLGLFCYARNYSPELVAYRVIFGIGGSASSAMLSACIADFSTEQDRGKFSGLIGFVSGLGAIAAVSVLLPLPAKIGLTLTFLIAASISLAVAILLIVISFLYQIEKHNPSRSSMDSIDDPATPLLSPLEERQSNVLSSPISHIFIKAKEILGKGVSASLQDGQIVLGYFASFLARSDSISINLFLPIWIFKYYVSKGECVDTNPGDLIKSSCHPAYIDASILSGVTQLFSLLGAPFVGYFLDKYDRKVIVLISSCLASLGYILTSQVSNPSSKVNIIYLGLVGLGEIGLIVSAVALVTHSGIPQDARGLISGISSFSGALGVLITSKIGGILFDISSGWPFLFLGLLHLVFIIVTSIYLAWTRFL